MDNLNWQVEVFFDGNCPLCTREIDFLKKRDPTGQIKFTDFTDQQFSESEVGISRESLDAMIHGRTPDGVLIKGVEVFRQMYSAIGWRVPVAISRWPLIRSFLNGCYFLFAKFRHRLTGRSKCTCAEECVTGNSK